MDVLSEGTTKGERTCYNYLKTIFTTKPNCYCYMEPQIGEKRPDFLLFSPEIGVVIIELKDNLPEHLVELNQAGQWKLLKDEQISIISNPCDQLYQYWKIIQSKVDFCKIPRSIEIPIIQILILSNIPEESAIGRQFLTRASRKVKLCFKEDFKQLKKFEVFLKDIVPMNNRIPIEIFDTIRGNIIPQCRLPILSQSNLLNYLCVEDQVKLLDAKQEKLARELGEGHRLIFGVAGSGKTIILIARARYLAMKHPKWNILILCYNRTLNRYLYQLLNPQNFDAKITINTFHGWSKHVIESQVDEFALAYRKSEKFAQKKGRMNDFFKEVVPKLLYKSLSAQSNENRFYYDAILIDEAQDFDSGWFQAIMQSLNPKTNSLLITCDGIQGIYARKKFTWSSVGIQAKGRVKRFSKSYRNPAEIGLTAKCILPKSISELIKQFDEFIATDEYSGKPGIVELVLEPSRKQEYHEVAKKIHRIYQQNNINILILFQRNIVKNLDNHPFLQELNILKIDWEDLKKFHYLGHSIHIGTLHSTKGLEADVVIIPELDTYTSDEYRQLLYVGITRASSRLILSACKSTSLIKSLQNIITQ